MNFIEGLPKNRGKTIILMVYEARTRVSSTARTWDTAKSQKRIWGHGKEYFIIIIIIYINKFLKTQTIEQQTKLSTNTCTNYKIS